MNTIPPGSAHSGKDQLIEAIYRIALEPQTYDAFMGQWDDYISSRVGALDELQSRIDVADHTERYPEIAKHFEIASQLLSQMEHRSRDGAALSGSRDPQFLLDGRGKVIWLNSAAERELALTKDSHISEMDLPERQLHGLQTLCLALTEPHAVPPTVILKLNSTQTAKPYYFYARILPEQHGDDIILVSKVTPDWPDDMTELLTDAFGLSPSEIDICALISDGQGAAQIADVRSSALATVRTQIKRIMGKTSCSTQAELVRLLHSVMRVAEQGGAGRQLRSHAPERTLYINLPDRVMPVEQFGDPHGRPVIYFHGMLDGNTMTHEFQALLRRRAIRLICPVRPWFGTAPGTEVPLADIPARFAQDVLEVMSQLQIPRAPLVGHMAGAIYAYATAQAAPEGKITGIVSVSGAVPITSLTQFSSMSTRQRLVAYTAKFTPRMLPFVLRAGISQMESGGDKKFMRSLYESSPLDQNVITDAETASVILAGYRFTVQQGHRAFQTDSHHVVSDWTAMADASTVPVHALHGRHDPVVNYDAVADFYATRANRARLTTLDECGQLVLYKHADHVIDAIGEMLELAALQD